MIHLRAFMKTAAAAAMVVCAAQGAMAQPHDPATLVKAELIAEPPAIRQGEPFTVGVRLTMKEHWHTYWSNPGDSGMATEIRWQLPPGFSAGAIAWPVPQAIPVGPLMNYGYEGTATLLVTITPPADLAPSSRAPLRATVAYLVCQRECIPGEAAVSLTLPVAGPTSRAPNAPLVETPISVARAALPLAAPFAARFSVGANAVTITPAAGGPATALRGMRFFPASGEVIDHAAPQTFTVTDGRPVLTLKRSTLMQGTPATLDGVLVMDEQVDGGTVSHAFAVSATPAVAVTPPVDLTALLQAIALAVLGGLILNLMPCVFPVLSLKVLQLTGHGEAPASQARGHGLAYAAGVLVTFAGLAALLYALRAAGGEVGWGFQLQSPVVVAALAFLLFAMGLSLSGVAQFGMAMTRVGTGAAAPPGLPRSFLTGFLATVVATPCTAPFMGTALGFALTQPPAVGMAVFLALGFGLALPVLVLTFVPALVRRLPRPGAWMETMKQVLAFPLYATVAWLVWVLSQQVGPTGMAAALAGLVLVGLAVFLAGKAHHAGRRGAWVARGVALAALLALLPAGRAIATDPGAMAAGSVRDSRDGTEPFTQARLDGLIAEGRRPVFVNLTAAWCITCLVNERTALASDEVRALFRARNVAYLKGDWTNRNPEITRVLERHGRSGVPLYLLFSRNGDAQLLPQILTERMLVDHLSSL
ncbi:MAG: protein-disulfide reductase DsbD family protein [Phreatobacter sp.]|uniref:protein-disulfide reductase DsbD family protein n=1 Tax=Phreatobacter sp. TaxID=1966341 RepID=UPI0027350DCF|nr:protein-disulfide reductase DsbD domain-containing protein [Phreatobacter sp.]MDP2802014.1 protein-disulfide reductase DsbD family protein [Phreatobacter sp.]